MSLITYKRNTVVSSALNNLLTGTGYVDVSGSPFLGSIIGAIQSALLTEYGKLYNIADNIDIGQASGEYLDRWGRFHNETRETVSYASDLTLTNCSVYLDPTITAGEITILGDGIVLNNVTMSNASKTLVFEALDQLYIRPDRSETFARVVCTTPGAVQISAGDLTQLSVNLTDISNVVPSLAATYSLKCRNRVGISSGTEMATETDYRYVIMKKAESVGLFNEAKVHSVMDATEVVKIIIDEYRGGANVFIETRNIQNVEAVVAVIRTALRQYRSLGYCINVYAPLVRYLTGVIKLSLKTEDPTGLTQSSFLSDFCTLVNNTEMGGSIDLSSCLSSVMTNYPVVTGSRIVSAAYAGRSMVKYNISQKFNEKVITSEDRFSIS